MQKNYLKSLVVASFIACFLCLGLNPALGAPEEDPMDRVEQAVLNAGDTATEEEEPPPASDTLFAEPNKSSSATGKKPAEVKGEKGKEQAGYAAYEEDASGEQDQMEESELDDTGLQESKPRQEEAPVAGGSSDSSAKQGLSDLSHEALIEGILQSMSSPDEENRIKAGLALRENVQLSDTPNLVKILKKGNNSDKQRFLVDVLGRLQDRRAGEALRFELRHGDEASQRAAVTALGRLKFDWAVPALVRTVRETEDEELCKRAASALGEVGTTSAEYALRTSLAALEEKVGCKNAAYWALEKIRGEVDDERIDTSMPKGRRLTLYYKGSRYFLYHPAYRRGASATKVGLRPWLLVCVHDNDLRVEDIFNICWRAGKKRQVAVLAPYFDNMRYPEYGNFNIWDDERTDKRLIELVEHVGKHAELTVREFYLFGYGTGGDFVQRFSMAYPKRIARAAFESNEFTKPDEEAFFPRGIHRSPFAPDLAINMYDFVKLESLLVLRKNSPVLNISKEYFEAMSHYAEVNGIRSRIGVRTVDVKFEIWNEAEKYLFSYD